ncbi:MAG: hypothetical protein V3U72_03535 [Candidatus Aenigmarchaeota archaeon]
MEGGNAKKVNCLICDIEKSNRGKPCKLCGMRSENPFYYRGFPFCCDKCVNHFKNIIRKTPADKRKGIMEKEIVI